MSGGFRLEIRLFRGLRHPSYFTYELREAEDPGRTWKRALLLIGLSGIVFGLGGYFGLGSEYLSSMLTGSDRTEYELYKVLHAIGQALWGLFYGTAIIYLSALWFWSMTDVDLGRYVIVQLMVLILLLAEQLLLIPVSILLDIPAESSPFSFGPMIQLLTENSYLIHLFGGITLFKLWAACIQYIYVRALSGKSRIAVLAMVAGLNLLYWLFGALFAVIKFENII